MKDLLGKLTGGDRRSIGRSQEVAAEVLEDPSLFDILFDGMRHEDPVVRMRSADAAEKASARRPGLLAPRKADLLRLAGSSGQQEVRWHVAQMIPRLDLDDAERAAAFSVMARYLDDESGIVRVCAMQALTDLAGDDAGMRPRTVKLLRERVAAGSPAVRSRGRKLLERLTSGERNPESE